MTPHNEDDNYQEAYQFEQNATDSQAKNVYNEPSVELI